MATLPLRQIEGKYEILDKIKEGGMGTIYKVRHRLLDEIRVVKVMRPQIADSEDLQRRFAREARAAIRLKHPNIAQLYDFAVEPEGVAYMVMEFIEGVTLQEMLARNGPAPLDLTLEIARQGLEALRYLHALGYVHRDVAPDNLMLTKDYSGQPQVKLIDLGIVKHLAGGGEGLTATGMFLGKVRYSSPEQFSGEKGVVDQRSDLYSFGVMLYELLTGKCPIVGDNLSQLVAAHLFQPPLKFEDTDPQGRVPEDVRAAVMRSLAKAPTDRFASAQDFEDTLVRPRAPQNLAQDLESTLATTLNLRSVVEQVKPGTTQDRLDENFGLVRTPGPGAGLRAADGAGVQTRAEQQAKLLQRARALAGERQWEEARSLLYQALSINPDHEESRTLLSSVETSLKQAIEEEKLHQAIVASSEAVAAHLGAERLDQARRELAQARTSLGEQPQWRELEAGIASLAAALHERQRAQEEAARRQRALGEAASRIGSLLDREQADAAARELDAALANEGADPRLDRLQARLESLRETLVARERERARQQAIGEALSQIESMVEREDADAAQAALEKASNRLGDDARFATAAEQVAKLRDVLAERERQRELEERRRLEEERKRQEAERLAREQEQRRREAAARRQEEERRQREAAEARRQEQERLRLEAEARSQEEERRAREAAQAKRQEEERRQREAEAARRQEEERRQRALAAKERADRLERLLVDARGELAAGRLDQAVARLESGRDEFEGDAPWRELFSRAEAESERRETERQREAAVAGEAAAIAKLIDQGRTEKAESRLAKARSELGEASAWVALTEQLEALRAEAARQLAEAERQREAQRAAEEERQRQRVAEQQREAERRERERAAKREADEREAQRREQERAAKLAAEAREAEQRERQRAAEKEAALREEERQALERAVKREAEAREAEQVAEERAAKKEAERREAERVAKERAAKREAEKREAKERSEREAEERRQADRQAREREAQREARQAAAPSLRTPDAQRERAIKPVYWAAAAGLLLVIAIAVWWALSSRSGTPSARSIEESQVADSTAAAPPDARAQGPPSSGESSSSVPRDETGDQPGASPGAVGAPPAAIASERAASAPSAAPAPTAPAPDARAPAPRTEPRSMARDVTAPPPAAPRTEPNRPPVPAPASPATGADRNTAAAPAARPTSPSTEPSRLPVQEIPAASAQPTAAPARPAAPPPPPPRIEAPPPAAPAAQSARTAADAAPPAAAPASNEKQSVLDTLARYRAAYQALDPDAVAAVFTGADVRDLRRAFKQYKSLSVEIDLGGCQIAVDGDNATAACNVTRVTNPKVGDRMTRSQRETFHLARKGSGWVVERVN